MLVLSNNDIASLLSTDQIIAEVESAMVAYEKNAAQVPQRTHMDHGNNTLLSMPAFGNNYFGTKLVCVVPGNRDKSLPVTNGAMVLNDAETGLPVALLNATKLTALRTAALGALGVRYLSPVNETSVGLIGCGLQGMHQAVFACSVRNVSKVYYLYRSKEKSDTFYQFVSQHQPGLVIEACHSTTELLDKTNIIIAATTSSTPVLPDDPELLNGKHFISVGSYKPSMQEFPDSVYRLAGMLAIDSEFARHETGDIMNPLKKGILKEENVFTLGKIITGGRTVDVNETTAYKSTGMALYDLFVAQAMYERAMQENIGTEVPF